MRTVSILNLTHALIHPLRAGWCASFGCQLRGLMFRRELAAEQGLLLVQAGESRWSASIHMLFMWMDLAVVWINTRGEVVDVRLARRWRPAYLPSQAARYVLEMPVGRLPEFQIGDQLSFVDEQMA